MFYPLNVYAMDMSGVFDESMNVFTEESMDAARGRYESYQSNRDFRQDFYEEQEEQMRNEEFDKLLYKDNFLPKPDSQNTRLRENQMGGLESRVDKPTRAFGSIRGRN